MKRPVADGIKLTFCSHDGVVVSIDGRPGDTLLQAALLCGVDGLNGECSGMAICATCHVYIPVTADVTVNPIGEIESETLDLAAAERTGESRLACQIEITDRMDGLRIRIPEIQ